MREKKMWSLKKEKCLCSDYNTFTHIFMFLKYKYNGSFQTSQKGHFVFFNYKSNILQSFNKNSTSLMLNQGWEIELNLNGKDLLGQVTFSCPKILNVLIKYIFWLYNLSRSHTGRPTELTT